MKKLRNKVFIVIFTLLTLFTTIIFITSVSRLYMSKKNTITNTLTKLSETYETFDILIENTSTLSSPKILLPSNTSRKIYLDFTIYTILLDRKGNYLGIINNSSNDNYNKEEIELVAKNIINNHTSNMYVGNILTNKYAYTYTHFNTLIIMDLTETKHSLYKELLSNLLTFIICEIGVLIIAKLLTNWIIEPVKKSFESQKSFVADASHELKTPLSVMIASADAYFTDHDEKWVKNMKNESERMIKLVTELLDLAKTEEEQEILMNNNNLSDIIEGSILTFESLFYEKNIKLKYDIDKDISMLCNENLITELMSILIDNAVRHTKEKDTVKVSLKKSNKQIILEVKNKGLPINKDEEEKIFERFYKVDNSRNRNNNNYGLGLAIAKNIVLKHHGTISAHSEKGYTTFKIIWEEK